MNIRYFLLPIFVLWGCTSYPRIIESSLPTHHEEGSVLVIGCVIIEKMRGGHLYTRNSWNAENPYIVVLGYRAADSAANKMRQIWVRTDANGYYVLPNASPGQYFLAGVGTQDESGSHTVSFWFHTYRNKSSWAYKSALVAADYNEEEGGAGFTPNLRAPEVWPEALPGNIFNFNYMIFTDSDSPGEGPDLQSYTFESLNGERFIGETDYFWFIRFLRTSEIPHISVRS